ncbi:hypothetical protein F2Q68_00040934 [Brassica cretica]|uniref:Uncharacterized protein n=1 Tax=Brassica cretica TaxID=69181 RepID=A0A8S9MHF7_BRACR|nr:hypothetical protein F2Q68_00040934 [Brassica cretica]
MGYVSLDTLLPTLHLLALMQLKDEPPLSSPDKTTGGSSRAIKTNEMVSNDEDVEETIPTSNSLTMRLSYKMR